MDNSTKHGLYRPGHEESAKKALLLKRKELRWKLMEASQLRNREKLEEIRMEASYNKRKMIKTFALATKLRAKYIKVAMAAKLAESVYKRVEGQLLTQEKFVADEKMQLTKLAVECQKVGIQLYGPEYRLSNNCRFTKDKSRQRLALKLEAAKAAMRCRMAEFEKKSIINSPAKRLLAMARAQARRKKAEAPLTRLSSLYNLQDSLLRNLAAYRLTTKFSETRLPLTGLNYTHNICLDNYICLPDLIGSCTDKNCLYQHRSNYLMTDIDKLVDLLSYKPSLTGFKTDPTLTQEENYNRCRIKLKEYAAKLLAKNSDKPVETIAANLVKYVRANKSDHDLLTMSRELPKVSHLVSPKLESENPVELNK